MCITVLPMNNKYTIALYASVISSMLVASMFAISFIQQAAAQGNQIGSTNQSSTGGGAPTGSNQTSSSAMTGAGPVTGGAASGKRGSSG